MEDGVLRDELFEAVQYGRMTPDEAEARAKQLGWAPLAEKPDPALFNPMGETWWTLPMAVAWIAWRAHTDVLDMWDTYRLECSDWHFRRWRIDDGPIHEGHFLEPRKAATLSQLALWEIDRSVHGMIPVAAVSVQNAKAKLWKALGENAMRATGINTESRQRVEISDYEWRDLEDFEENGRDVVRTRDGRLVSARGYDDLTFRRQNIMAIWQPNRMDERGLHLPDTVSPDGPGYMPLYCAAQWIATRGGAVRFDPTYTPVWEGAYSQLLARIASNEVSITGMRDGVREKIEGHIFASIPVSYPFLETPIDLLLGDEMYLSSYTYLDEDHWRKGFDDSLEDQRGAKWSKLLVLKSDVARWWTFKNESALPETHSGAPGRPSSMHLIEAEYDARIARGEAKGRIAEVAAALATWAKATHPNLRLPTAATIANHLRRKHRLGGNTS
jgi:hypothetical protein